MQAPNVQLYPGSTDTANVKKLQDYLVSQGLMSQEEVDTGYGIYGPKTTAAVSKLQQQLGVDTSAGGVGNFGPATSAATIKKTTQTAPIQSTSVQDTINKDLKSGYVKEIGVNAKPQPTPIVQTPIQKSTPTVEELIKTYQFGGNQGSYNAGEDMTTDVFSARSTDPNVLTVNQTKIKPVDISATTNYPVRNNEADPVQSNTKPTPAYGANKMDEASMADAINYAQGTPTNYMVPDSRGILSQLIADRAMGRGLYAIEPGMQYSPEQINARRNAADFFYTNQIGEMIQQEKAEKQSNMLGELDSRQSAVVQQINSSLDASPITKQYIELQSQYNNMVNSVGKGNGAGDIATIYTFMKSLDPDSVVRETEYETGAQKSGNIFSGYMAKFNGLINPNGGFVSQTAKDNILSTIKDRFAVKGQQYKNFRDQKVQQLEKRGIPNANDFVTEYDFTFESSAPEGQGSTSQGSTSSTGISPLWDSF